jgi:hypothetical protein
MSPIPSDEGSESLILVSEVSRAVKTRRAGGEAVKRWKVDEGGWC